MTPDERKRGLRAAIKAKVDAYRVKYPSRPGFEVHAYRERVTWDVIDSLVDEIADIARCTCGERSWYGEEHDTACPLEGKR